VTAAARPLDRGALMGLVTENDLIPHAYGL
jgi:hypothetical protein